MPTVGAFPDKHEILESFYQVIELRLSGFIGATSEKL